MDAATDLEIGLHRRLDDGYAVEMTLTSPEMEGDERLAEPALARIDTTALAAVALQPDAYGALLGEALFASDQARDFLNRARGLTSPLRFRLFIGPTAQELHPLLWETLRLPGDDVPLAMSQGILFSRYLSGPGWRRVRRRARSDLKTLVVVANPTDPNLAPVDVAEEVGRAQEALDGVATVTILARQPDSTADCLPTFENLQKQLRSDPPDLLYVVCHGRRPSAEETPGRPADPVLFLEDPDGGAHIVKATVFESMVDQLWDRPRMIALVACQSARDGNGRRADDGGALAAIGPRLARAGVPAVLAMQGDVSMDTVSTFMCEFFQRLAKDGWIDRAVAEARTAVGLRPDHWMPVLFLRLPSGRLWYQSGDGSFKRWPSVVNRIHAGNCVAIVGSGLLESVAGSPQELAHRLLAASHPYQPGGDYVDDPVQIARVLAVNQGEETVRSWYLDSIKDEMIDRFGESLTADERTLSLPRLMAVIGERLRVKKKEEPHNVLAHLPFKGYFTTNPDSLLVGALRAAGKEPRICAFEWWRDPAPGASLNTGGATEEQTANEEPAPRLDADHPLVYYLFGRIDSSDPVDPIICPRIAKNEDDLDEAEDGDDSAARIVLTEDNYFDYLVTSVSNRHLHPRAFGKVLTTWSLLFIGFRLEDWDFRVLFRSMIRLVRGSVPGKDPRMVLAVQVDPEGSQFSTVAEAEQYLTRFLNQEGRGIGVPPDIYWGSAQDFLDDLRRKWATQYGVDPVDTTEAVTAAASQPA